MDDEIDYLPISMLNQLEYCERRFWLMFVCGEMELNAPMLEGMQQHEQVHSGGTVQDGEWRALRRVYIWSDRLRVAGFADVVEVAGSGPEALLRPVEHKHGRMGRWLNDHIQLCAQGMCLEERTGRPVEGGEIFYWGSRRRVSVRFDAELRSRTEAAIANAFALIQSRRIPTPLEHRAKCRDCSLEAICLPRETLWLNSEGESDG